MLEINSSKKGWDNDSKWIEMDRIRRACSIEMNKMKILCKKTNANPIS